MASIFKWLPSPDRPQGPRRLPPSDRTEEIAQAASETRAASERTLALIAMRDFAREEMKTIEKECDRLQKLLDTLGAFVTVVDEQCR